MKKLMIAVAIVCAAATSQAAAVTWQLSAVTGSEGKQAAGGLVTYLVDASKYAAFTALQGDAVASFFNDSANYKATGVTTTARTGTSANFSKEGNYSPLEKASAFMVLFDATSAAAAKNYAYTTIGSETIPEGGSDKSVNFGTFADAMAAGGSSAGWQSLSSGPTPIPEPTSGLLLLLGMAGLALRRRRA